MMIMRRRETMKTGHTRTIKAMRTKLRKGEGKREGEAEVLEVGVGEAGEAEVEGRNRPKRF